MLSCLPTVVTVAISKVAKMSKITLYGFDKSPAVRACLLTLHAMDLPYEYKVVDLFKGEHMSEEFQKLNPQHTVPVLQDADFCIWDSHAINAYLVDKYGKDDKLYPKDLQKRALVNQRLFFEASNIFVGLRNIIMPFYKRGETVVPKDRTEHVIENYDLLEKFLVDKTFVAGEHVTIADFASVTMISSLHGLVPIDAEKYPKLSAWLARMESLPYYEKANGKGNKEYVAFLKSQFTKIEL